MYKILGNDQKEYGPVNADQLRQWIREGRANSQTRVQVAGSFEWQPLGMLPEFFPAARAASTSGGYYQPSFTRRTHALAVAALVMGILALTCGFCCCYGLPFNILGIIFAVVAMIQIKARPEMYNGKGLAIAGLVICLLSLLLIPLIFFLGLAFNQGEIFRELEKL